MDRDAAGEIDIQQVLAPLDYAGEADGDDDARDDAGQATLAQEIDLGFAEYPHHGQFGDPSLLFGDIEDDARTEDGRIHTQDDAEEEGNGEATDLIGADVVEDDGRDQGGQVGIDDGGSGPTETVSDRHAQRGASAEFLADPLEDQHVGVDGHTDGQHQPG